MNKPFLNKNDNKKKKNVKKTFKNSKHKHNTNVLIENPSSPKASIRIGKFLSALGLCSRREAVNFLQENEVLFQKKRIEVPNFYLSESDVLQINGKDYTLQQKKIFLLHKPLGYVCSHRSFKNQPSIFELLPHELAKFYFAGRLDADSSGLVVLSNDGDFIHYLTHPSQKIPKKYLVHCSRPLSQAEQEKILRGIWLKREKLKADRIEKKSAAHYLIELHTGRNREIRRMLEALHVGIISLMRLQMGVFELKDLSEGQFLEVEQN